MTTTDMRSLTPAAKLARRLQVIALRDAGHSFARVAELTGLSRTGVFDICKRHDLIGGEALHDAPSGRKTGDGRRLAPQQEALLCQMIVDHTPDELTLPQSLWTRGAVTELIERHLGLHLPVRTMATYLARWGFASGLPLPRRPGPRSAAEVSWLAHEYPGIAAASTLQDGEIGWVGHHRLAGRLRRSMIWSVNNKQQQRWQIFAGVLDAPTLIGFLRRLVRGATRKSMLILDSQALHGDPEMAQWLLANEEAIQVFRIPGEGALPCAGRD